VCKIQSVLATWKREVIEKSIAPPRAGDWLWLDLDSIILLKSLIVLNHSRKLQQPLRSDLCRLFSPFNNLVNRLRLAVQLCMSVFSSLPRYVSSNENPNRAVLKTKWFSATLWPTWSNTVFPYTGNCNVNKCNVVWLICNNFDYNFVKSLFNAVTCNCK